MCGLQVGAKRPSCVEGRLQMLEERQGPLLAKELGLPLFGER